MVSIPSPAASYRLLGGFRFLLAMLVLLQHGLLLLAPEDRGAFYDMELGSVAVTTFFAVSGFVVAESASTFYAGRPGAFLANRVLRLVPPYLAALALTVALDGWLFHAGWLVPLDAPLRGSPLVPSIVLGGVLEIVPGLPARRISGQDFSFIPFAWTLRIEFVFYLAVFAVGCAVALRRGHPGWRRAVVLAAIPGAYTVFVAFVWFRGRFAAGGPLQVICIPFFAFGVCAFLYAGRPGLVSRLHLVLVSAGVLLGFTFWGQRGHPVVAYQLPLLAVLYATLVWLTGLRAISLRLRRWDRRLGDLSYPLYISHGAVLTLLASVSAERGALPYLEAVVASLLLAAALHLAVEQPLRTLRTRVRGVAV